jgi:hypothetical protein
MAWIVILTSFAVFCLLAVIIPFTVTYVIRYATVSETARLESTLGMPLLLYTAANDGEPTAVTTPRDDIGEGSKIVANEAAVQGALGLVSNEEAGQDEVLGSVQLYPNTELHILRVRRPLFRRSPEPIRVQLWLERGQAQFFTNSGDRRPVDVEVETPHGVVSLNAGAYWIRVDDEQTEVTARTGMATLTQDADPDARLIVNAGLRAWMGRDGIAQEALSAEENLVRNGSFTGSVLDTWSAYRVADYLTPGVVQFEERDGRNTAYFSRQGDDIAHNEVGIVQQIDQDVRGYDQLTLQLDVNILWQSLSGAGISSSEFPVRVEINYTDVYGKDLNWGYGFYYRDPEDQIPDVQIPKVPENLGVKIVQAQWYHYASENLIDLWGQQNTRPARINSIRIYASGWNYRSMVSEVYLIAQ